MLDLEDDGFIDVKIGDVQVRLDLFAVHDKLADFHAAHKSASDHDYNEGILDLMSELGLPRGSHRLAVKFVRGIQSAMESLAKGS